MHKAIYDAYPEVNAINHVHSEHVVLAAIKGKDIPLALYYMLQSLGGTICCVPYATPGSVALAQSGVRGLRGERATLLGNHGGIAIGTTSAEALKNTKALEKYARIFIKTGRQFARISREEQRKLPELFKKYGQPKKKK